MQILQTGCPQKSLNKNFITIENLPPTYRFDRLEIGVTGCAQTFFCHCFSSKSGLFQSKDRIIVMKLELLIPNAEVPSVFHQYAQHLVCPGLSIVLLAG